RVANRHAATTRPRITELEAAVLVVGAAGNTLHVDLVVVVLTGTLEREPELQRVIVDDLGQVGVQRVDRTRGVGRIRAPRVFLESRDIDRRQLVRAVLTAVDVRVGDPILGPI